MTNGKWRIGAANDRVSFKSREILLLLVTAIVLLYGVIYPNLHLVLTSFQHNGQWSFGNYAEVWSPGVFEAILNSVGLSVGTVLLCALVGIPLAFIFERYSFPGRRLFAALAALPLVLPPLVGTIAFIFLCGESGILARAVQASVGLASAPWSLRGWGALLLFHTYTMYPFFYMLTGAGLRRIDAGLAVAARSLGASALRVFFHVVLPQLTPSLIAASLLTFMTSMASFSAPLLFGGSIRVLTLEIFNARQRGDMGMAVIETVVLGAISLGALLFFQRYEGTRRFVAAAMKGAPARRRPLTTGRRRTLAILGGITFSTLLALPVFTLVLVSLAQESNWTTQALPPSYTLSNYAQLLKDPNAFEPFLNSISMAAIAAFAALVWSFCVSRLVTSGKRYLWKRVLSILVLVPWALPGTVVAMTIAEAYGKPTWLMGSYILVGTFWILPVIYFLRFMPLVVRAVQASMEQMDPTFEQAAETLGARWWQRFVRIIFPLTLPGALAGSLMAFIIALGEYVASVLVFVPTNRPISIAIASELRDFRLGLAAAYGVVLIGIIALSMIAAAKIERWRA